MRRATFLISALLALAITPSLARSHDRLVLTVHRSPSTIDLSVAGAQPGMPIVLFAGTKEGHTTLFPGTDTILRLTIGLAPPFGVLVLGAADAHGKLSLRANVSGPIPKTLLQAVSPAQLHHRVLGWRLSQVVPIPHD